MRYLRNANLVVGLILLPLVTNLVQAQEASTTARVDAVQQGQGSEVVINQIDTSAFPKVAIFATVLRNSQPVLGLTASDFRVREDEVDQEPLTVIPQRAPLHAVVTLDTSGSIRKALPQVQTAAVNFLNVLESDDSVTVLGFAREVKVLSSKGSRAQAESAIKQTVARGDTALFDALYESISTLQTSAGRKAVVLLSDGVDDDGKGQRLSKRTIDEVLALAQQVNVPVFAIGLGTELDRETLRRVAEESRGRFFEAPSVEQLQEIYDQIGKELSGQYHIHYTSNLPADGSTHRVNLSQGDVFGYKEFIAPTATAVAEVPVATTTMAETTQVTEEKIISSAVGLHIAARMTDQGDAVTFDAATVFTKPATAFEKPKRVEVCYNKERCSFTVPTGAYQVEVKKGSVTRTQDVVVEAGKAVQAWVNLDAGGLRVVGLPVPDAQPIKMNTVYVRTINDAFSKSERVSTCYNKDLCEFILPAGKYIAEVSVGKAKSETEVEIKAGGMTDTSLVLQASGINAIALMQDNGAPVKFDKIVVNTKGTAFDKPKQVDSCYNKERCSFTVGAGDYLVEAHRGEAKAQQEVNVPAGKTVDVTLVLNAGEGNIALTRDGKTVTADKVEIIRAASSSFDKPKTVYTCYKKDICSRSLPAGNYLAEVKVGATVAKKEFTIAAGQSLNLEVQLVE